MIVEDQVIFVQTGPLSLAVAGGITADSACSTLISAHSALTAEEGEEEEEGSVVREVEQCCMEYIETNTRAVFKSKGFLQLPKETLPDP